MAKGKSITLPIGDRLLLGIALRIAHEQFGRDAVASAAVGLSEQFKRQQADAARLLNLIDRADSVTLGGVDAS